MRRVLVVEDEFFVAIHIDDILSESGFEVVGPVGTLTQARLLAKDESLNGALLDVNIEGGRVDEVADILARRDVPFMFVTAYGRDSLPRDHRAATLVNKPFRDKLLLGELQSLLAH